MRVVCYDPNEPLKPCPICQGMGVIKYDVPVDHPAFGKLHRCPNFQADVDDKRRETLRRLSNLDAFAEKTFDNFEIDLPMYSHKQIESLGLALGTARQYAYQPQQPWLVLMGPYGCGKTHLAAAIGNAVLAYGEAVIFITTPDLLDHLRSAYGPSAETAYDQLFERLRSVGLLILDDLGTENPSPWAREKLFQLLNHRHSYHKRTVITTNNAIDDLDGRLHSRLLDTGMVSLVSISAPDYRSGAHQQDDPLRANLNLYRDMTFDNFEILASLPYIHQDNLQRVRDAAQSYAERPSGWFVLASANSEDTQGHGNGKTHLAAAIANERRAWGDDVILTNLNDLLDYLRDGFNESASSSNRFDRRMRLVRDAYLLILDDLRTIHQSDWAREKIFQIVDYRYVRRLRTVFTFNSLKEVDRRISVRLMDPELAVRFEITSPSYAMQKKKDGSNPGFPRPYRHEP